MVTFQSDQVRKYMSEAAHTMEEDSPSRLFDKKVVGPLQGRVARLLLAYPGVGLQSGLVICKKRH